MQEQVSAYGAKPWMQSQWAKRAEGPHYSMYCNTASDAALHILAFGVLANQMGFSVGVQKGISARIFTHLWKSAVE